MVSIYTGFSCAPQVFPAMQSTRRRAILSEMPSIHRKIKRLRKARGLTLETFAKEVGVSWQSAQQWEKDPGGTAPHRKRMNRVAEVLGVAVAELLSGNLDNEPGPKIRGKVPLISWAAAGQWYDVHDPFQPGEADEWIYTTKTVSANAFALRVVGDSMEPKIPDGSIVIIDPAVAHKHGSIVLAKRTQDQQATLKQLWYDGAEPKLKPLNDRYPIMEMPSDTKIIGVAVKLELDV